MKVAISLPDPVFRAAEQLAKSLNKPRSRLYAEAIEQYVGIHGAHAVTERLDAVYGKESSTVDEALQQAQSRVLADETW
jgi:metal-responsive CopG/Arc/MetJ family transcriptional regulator